jgi:hypothetical protein
MSTKNERKTRHPRPAREGVNLSAIDDILKEPEQNSIADLTRRHWRKAAVCAFILLFGIGVFAKKGWLPHTDILTGKKTGWFGHELSKNATSTWNPFATVFSSPTPTPQLSKEYIYAGSKLLAVADANANAAAPADLAIWRPSTGAWSIFTGDSESESTAVWGLNGDVPVQGDYDGDGKTDFCVFRPNPSPIGTAPFWSIVYSSDGSEHYPIFGLSTDIPVPADFDGDGKTDVSVWRPSDLKWYITQSSTGTIAVVPYGLTDDKPVPADFDGDGKADPAVWRSSDQKFHFQGSSDGLSHASDPMGTTGIPVCADYDGDGKADFAILSGNNWRIKSSSTGETTNTTWYYAGDTPVPNDYDGDGKVDIAVWHIPSGFGSTNAYWCIRQSSDLEEPRINMFGRAGDIPVPANYRR